MTFTDWLIDIALILIVVRQLRVGRVDPRFVILPLALLWFAASNYMHGVPTTGGNLPLLAAFAVIGVALGVVGGMWTRVWSDGQKYALVQASMASAGLWVASMTVRLGFIYWITHSGTSSIARFSTEHHISANAWSTGLILLAGGEVVARMAVIVYRAYLVNDHKAARTALSV